MKVNKLNQNKKYRCCQLLFAHFFRIYLQLPEYFPDSENNRRTARNSLDMQEDCQAN